MENVGTSPVEVVSADAASAIHRSSPQTRRAREGRSVATRDGTSEQDIDVHAELRNLLKATDNYRKGGGSRWGEVNDPDSLYLRQYGYAGRKIEINEFRGLSEDAGRCLLQAPKSITERLPPELQRGQPGLVWTGYLFELAWSGQLGSPLRATKNHWLGSSRLPLNLEEVRGMLPGIIEIVKRKGRGNKGPPDRFCSILQDALTASAYALDYLEVAAEGVDQSPNGENPAVSSDCPEYLVERHDDVWRFYFAGREVLLRDRLGLHFLSRLIAEQGSSVPALELVWEYENAPKAFAKQQDLIDKEARLNAQREYEEIEEEWCQAKELNDSVREEHLREEKEKLAKYLCQCLSLGGESRSFSDDIERARVNVTKNINRTLSYMKTRDQALGLHFKQSIDTGTYVTYAPLKQICWEIR